MPGDVLDPEPGRLAKFYPACRNLMRLIRDPAYAVSMKLEAEKWLFSTIAVCRAVARPLIQEPVFVTFTAVMSVAATSAAGSGVSPEPERHGHGRFRFRFRFAGDVP